MTRIEIHSANAHKAGGFSNCAPSAMREIERIATKIRLGRGQTIEFRPERLRPVLIVRSGYLVVRLEFDQVRRSGALLVPASGMVRLASLPMFGPFSIAAAEPTVLLRIEEAEFDHLMERELAVRQYALEEARRQFGYDQLHIALLSALRGEERLAGLLLALAARGHPNGGNAISVDMPVSRTDLAHHLALNPDTLSRVVSRFKARGLIAMPNRRTFRIIDPAGLSALSAVGQMGMVNTA